MFMVRVACSSAAASLEILDKEYVDSLLASGFRSFSPRSLDPIAVHERSTWYNKTEPNLTWK